MSSYPLAKNSNLVGTYYTQAESGGGYVWDDVLEYRVCCHPERGAPDLDDGNDYFYSFESYEAALSYSEENPGTESPMALVLQEEYIDEPELGQYVHVKEQRITEWQVEWLSRPRRNEHTIPDFIAPDAPANRLDILRGLAT